VTRALDGMRVMGYRGLSVTIPHKVEAMAGVDEVVDTARRIGCINTVVNENGRLIGYNSDGLFHECYRVFVQYTTCVTNAGAMAKYLRELKKVRKDAPPMLSHKREILHLFLHGLGKTA